MKMAALLRAAAGTSSGFGFVSAGSSPNSSTVCPGSVEADGAAEELLSPLSQTVPTAATPAMSTSDGNPRECAQEPG